MENKCGIKQYATCVYYELDLPSISSLTGEDCVTMEQTTRDLYNLIEQQNTNIDISSVQTDCLENLPENYTISDLVEAQNLKICELENTIQILQNESICDKSITECGIDLTGLIDSCDEPITTLGQYLQFIAQNLQ